MRARAGVEDEIDAIAERSHDVRGRRGRHVHVRVGARRRERLAHGANERERDRMLGCADPDGVETAGHDVRHVRRANGHDERERSGPERGGEA